MAPCGSPKCSVECRRKWAWKNALCAMHAFESHPPDYHLVLRPKGKMSEKALSKLIGKLFVKLRRCLEGDLEYGRVFEWKKNRVHAHVWLRTSHEVSSEVVSSLLPPGIEFSCEARRGTGVAVAKYMFKDVKDDLEKTQLPPADFRGRVYFASRGFLGRPMKQLWKEIQAERK